MLFRSVKDFTEGEGRYFTEERISAFLKGLEDPSDVAKYFSNTLRPEDQSRVEKALYEQEKGLSPDKSKSDIFSELDALRGQ